MLPPEYDDVHPNSYDPAYTADISTKMRIPHKIDAAGVTEGETMKAEEERHMNTRRAASMHIPHKIVLDGELFILRANVIVFFCKFRI